MNEHFLSEAWDLPGIQQWISDVLPNRPPVLGPTAIYNEKPWGMTVEFVAADKFVVFKGCKLPLFSKRGLVDELLSRCCPNAVPALLAWIEPQVGQTWTLYGKFNGLEVAKTGQTDRIIEMASVLARIQIEFANLPQTALATLPVTQVNEIPLMLEQLRSVIEDRYLAAWQADDEALLKQFDLSANILEWLDYFQPRVERWVHELVAGHWPLSIDHVDLNTSNAAILEDGRLFLLDWEEAQVGCPFFSIDRLLHDADDFEVSSPQQRPTQGRLPLTPNQMCIRDAYIDSIPWQARVDRERAFDLAMCLAPIKMAYEGELFNAAIGRANGSPEHAARCLAHALHRWQSMPLTRPME